MLKRQKLIVTAFMGSLLLLGGCKKVPIENDVNEQKQAIETLKKYLPSLLKKSDNQRIKRLTSLPVIIDGHIFKTTEKLLIRYAKDVQGIPMEKAKIKFIEVQYSSLTAIKKDKPRRFAYLKKYGLHFKNTHPFKFKLSSKVMAYTEIIAGYALMIKEEGRWKVKGII